MRRRRARDAGSVTAELAVALVPVAVLLLLAGWLAAAGAVQLRVQLAAGSAARALARGEDQALVARRVAEVAGGAVLRVEEGGDVVRVDVTAPLRAPGLGEVGSASGTAVVPTELLDGGGP